MDDYEFPGEVHEVGSDGEEIDVQPEEAKQILELGIITELEYKVLTTWGGMGKGRKRKLAATRLRVELAKQGIADRKVLPALRGLASDLEPGNAP